MWPGGRPEVCWFCELSQVPCAHLVPEFAGPAGGGDGGVVAPARQGALTAAIAATPAIFFHSRHLKHTTISSTHAGGMHSHAGGDMGVPLWWQLRGGIRWNEGENRKTPNWKVA